jgi:ankyrin repeat protein
MKSKFKILLGLFLCFALLSGVAKALFFESENVVESIKRGDLNHVKQYVKDANDVNAVKEGKSLLMVAIEEGQYDIFRFLLENGANPNFRNDQADPRKRQVIMELASVNNDSRFLEQSLRFGGDPDALSSYQRPILTLAVTNLENTKLLIMNGSNINAVGANGNSAVHRAARIKNYDVAYYLIQQRADISIPNKFGKTVVDTIKQFGDAGVNPSTQYYKYYLKVLDALDIPLDSVPSHN